MPKISNFALVSKLLTFWPLKNQFEVETDFFERKYTYLFWTAKKITPATRGMTTAGIIANLLLEFSVKKIKNKNKGSW